MKRKYFLLVLFLILAIFLSGCSGGGTTPPITPNQSPTASFTANPTSGTAPLEVSFNGSNSSDSDGTIISYAWDFKDGNTGTGQSISHTFSSAGSYNVELTVTDDEGATDSATKTITITDPITTNQSPTASFTANPTSGTAPLAVSFNASNSSDSDGTIISYVWDFKDGSTGSGQTINHTFSSTGSYSVKLTVTDDKGATGSTTKTITVTYEYKVEYKIWGSATSVFITLSNSTVGTEQYSDVILPKVYSYSYFSDNFLYISAQNNGSSGTVNVECYYEGVLKDSAHSEGAYVIATASWYNSSW